MHGNATRAKQQITFRGIYERGVNATMEQRGRIASIITWAFSWAKWKAEKEVDSWSNAGRNNIIVSGR